MKPKYPIYIPSKGRADVCYTAKFFLEDGVDFKLVVEPSQLEEYKKYFPEDIILVLPKDGLKLLGSRLWIREHSIQNGHSRHWQFDDNIRLIGRLHKGKRIRCNANIAINIIEEFTDRYENIGISGFNYKMFVTNHTKKPYYHNVHVYSASLINNNMPYKWRLYYNDDTDICLQVLSNNLCTVLFNAVFVDKIATMVVKGGNTSDLYKGNGRLKMARALEEIWPNLVKTKWRFGRPQHVVNWNHFKQKLKRKKLDWNSIKDKKFDIKLTKKDEIKSPSLRRFYEGYQ